MVTYIVANTNDAGNGSLRKAIDNANISPGKDIIQFNLNLDNRTITLTSGQLQITDDLEIRGLGSEKLIIDGNQRSRVFLIDDETDETIKVTLKDISVSNGRVENILEGGGILNTESLRLIDSIISGNQAGQGGAIANSRGHLQLKNTAIHNNISEGPGGGVLSRNGIVQLRQSHIIQNQAKNYGGGVYVVDSQLTVKSSEISQNSVTDSVNFDSIVGLYGTIGIGGGIFAQGSQVELSDSQISDNLSGGSAGGINVQNSTLNVTNSSISNNSAKEYTNYETALSRGTKLRGVGGGISVTGSQVDLDTVQISDNEAGKAGAGLDIRAGRVSIYNSVISGNKNIGYDGVYSIDPSNETTEGAGIFNTGELSIASSTIANNIAGGNPENNFVSASGGGIYNAGDLAIANSTISGNQSASGGYNETISRGGGLYNRGTTLIANSTITENRANYVRSAGFPPFTLQGGGIHSNQGTLKLSNTIVAGNFLPPNSPDVNAKGPDVFGAVESQGYNLIGIQDGSLGSFNVDQGDQVGSLLTPLNPGLGDLQLNGGVTPTHALLPESSAIDAGDLSFMGERVDQRGAGFPRTVDGNQDGESRIDIGALEQQPVPRIRRGTRADDRLSGTLDNDIINGLFGDDTLIGLKGDDLVLGALGNDRLLGGKGDDTLRGGGGQDYLQGSSGRDILVGGTGRDRLMGGQGADMLRGGLGVDQFVFQHSRIPADRILDFEPEKDVILLQKSGFDLDVSLGELFQGRFTVGSHAQDAGDRVIYNDQTGALLFDADGSRRGEAKVITILQPGLNLRSANFRVF